MANGVIVESRISATNVDALNRFCVSENDVAGGALIALAAPAKQGDENWVATTPTTGALGGLWIAYNPSEHYTEVNGKMFAGLSADPRDFVNIKKRPFSAFKPVAGVDQIEITADCIDDASGIVVGDFLEAKAGQSTFTRVAKATGATAGSTAFQVEWIGTKPFPKKGIGMEYATVYKAVCVQE